MVKASALYIVIVMALVMALLCSSLIAAAYFYRLQYQRTFRYATLRQHLQSGINILLGSTEAYTEGKTISLFHTENDSLLLKRQFWGTQDIGVVKAFIQQDTLTRVFSIAHSVDSAKWCALYIIDEDRSLSVSGKTLIKGNAFIPKAGIKEAYVNNQAYEGDKRLIIGTQHNSEKTLPVLDATRLQQLEALWQQPATDSSDVIRQDTLQQSFLSATRIINLHKQAIALTHLHVGGNLMLRSDTSITLDSTVTLENALVMAKSIIVKSGFKGTCQLYASDSIAVGRNCTFGYPSALGVLNFSAHHPAQSRIVVGEKTEVNGVVLIYQKDYTSTLQPLIDLGKHTLINGQVYVPGLLNYQETVTINGSVYVNRFLYQTAYTRYENYLIGLTLNAAALSPYYLTSSLLPVAASSQHILQWLEPK